MMKKIIQLVVLVVIIALAYPYAKDLYQTYVKKNVAPEDVAGFVAFLNKGLPKQQGLLTYDSAVDSVGSVIILINDASGMFNGQNKVVLNSTWQPFVVAHVCNDKTLARALHNGIVRGVYYQFHDAARDIDYAKVLVSPEMCPKP